MLCYSRARGDFCQAVLVVARYQGAQYSRWRHSRHARGSATPVRRDNSATEYHNAYAVDPTVYAAIYTASTGTSPMGQVKTPLGGPDPHILSGPLSGEETNSPPEAGPEPPCVHRYGHAHGREASLEDSPTYRIQCGRCKCALPQQSPIRLLSGCTFDRALPRRTVQPLAPPTPRASVCYAC